MIVVSLPLFMNLSKSFVIIINNTDSMYEDIHICQNWPNVSLILELVFLYFHFGLY